MDSMKPEPSQSSPAASDAQDRKKTFARRALIQAGWALPVTAMIAMPKTAGAVSVHSDSGGAIGGPPGSHADITQHNDVVPGHNDAVPHVDFTAGPPHGDNFVPHFDNGAPHNDFTP